MGVSIIDLRCFRWQGSYGGRSPGVVHAAINRMRTRLQAAAVGVNIQPVRLIPCIQSRDHSVSGGCALMALLFR